jgi:hypothetical protein
MHGMDSGLPAVSPVVAAGAGPRRRLVSLAIALCCAVLPAVAIGQSWIAEYVDSSSTIEACTLVPTDGGKTYLIYVGRVSGTVLKCACRGESTWSFATLDSNGWQYPSKPRQNAAGLPEFAYARTSLLEDTWQLRVMQLSDSGWVTTTADSGPWFHDVIVTPSPRPSYALTGSGTRAVAYGCVTSDSTWDVRVAHMVADTWQRETVWSGERYGAWLWVPEPYLSLVPGDTERLWFSLYNPASVDTGYLCLASRTDTGWAVDTVDRVSGGGYDLYASEADADGHHIVYTSTWRLCYRTGSPDSWAEEVVRAPFGRGKEAADLVMSEGTAYIVASSTMDPLFCSYYVPPTWVHETMPPVYDGYGPCISRESDGTLVACYWTSPGLLYARRLADGVAEDRGTMRLQGSIEVCPNPARGTFTVRYEVPGKWGQSQPLRGQTEVQSPFSLGIYDAGGRLVRSLTDGEAPPGRHEVHLPTGALPAGIYFLHLDTPGFRSVKKVVVMR